MLDANRLPPEVPLFSRRPLGELFLDHCDDFALMSHGSGEPSVGALCARPGKSAP